LGSEGLGSDVEPDPDANVRVGDGNGGEPGNAPVLSPEHPVSSMANTIAVAVAAAPPR
jgi:hypothetical protein